MTLTDAVEMTLIVECDFADDGTWTDISEFVELASVSVGIHEDLLSSRIAAVGQCTLTVKNEDRRFSPLNTEGPYYGQLLPNRPIRVRAWTPDGSDKPWIPNDIAPLSLAGAFADNVDDTASVYPIFRGYVWSWNPESGGADQDGPIGGFNCVIQCQDELVHVLDEGIVMPLQTSILSSTLIRHIINIALKATVATALITMLAIPSNNNTFVVNGTTLTWKTTLSGGSNEVLIGATLADSTTNLKDAINQGDGAGTRYSSTITLPRIVTATAGYASGYDSGNVDTNVYLRGNTGAGGTTTVTAVDNAIIIVGNGSGIFGVHVDTWMAQSFTVTGGRLTQFTVEFGANEGSPTGTVTWQLHADSSGSPGTVLTSGTFTPTQNSNNTISIGLNGIALQSSTTYWLSLHSTATQSTDVFWEVNGRNDNPYANGTLKTSSGGSGWTEPVGSPTFDAFFSVTTEAVTTKDKLAQSFQVSVAQALSSLGIYLRKIGTPTGTLTLRIESDASGSPSGALVDANAETTLSEASLATSFASVTFTFSAPPSILSSTTYWLVLSTSRSASATDFVAWGADASSPGYTSGEMKSYASSTWSAESKDAAFNLGVNSVVLQATLRGTVGNAYTLSKTGSWATVPSVLSGGEDFPLATPPDLETGQNTFQYAGDNWDSDKTNAMTALQQTVDSEFLSMLWVDRDGRIKFKNRNYIFTQANITPALTLSSEQTGMDGGLTADEIFNIVEVVYTPLATLSSGIIASAKSAIAAPGLTGLTERWNPTQVLRDQAGTVVAKLPFIDPGTGEKIGALSIITPLVATTDWTANEAADGSGVSYTGSARLKFSVSIVGSNAEVTIYNDALGPIYITQLNIRGVGLHRYNPSSALVEDATSQDTYRIKRRFTVTLPFASTAGAFPQNLAGYLLSKYKDPAYRIHQISFQELNKIGNVNLFSLNIGDVIEVTDYMTAVSEAKYIITGINYPQLGQGSTGEIVFTVFPLADVTFWLLGVTGFSELGETTRLGL